MCVCVCVCVYTQTTYITFVYSSVNGHSGCFHMLATVNDAAMNIEMHTLFLGINVFCVFLKINVQSEISGSYGSSSSIFTFLRNFHIVLIFIFSVCTILYSYHVLTNTFFCLFDNSHYDRCEVISHCDFDFHFLDD